jgi:hypothetical protein
MEFHKRWKVLNLIGFLFILSVLLISCGTNRSKDNLADAPNNQIENVASEWSENLILTFNGNTYKVTKEKTNDINQRISEISYHGNGAIFPLYSIKNIKNYDEIAVKTKSGYLIATKNHQ